MEICFHLSSEASLRATFASIRRGQPNTQTIMIGLLNCLGIRLSSAFLLSHFLFYLLFKLHSKNNTIYSAIQCFTRLYVRSVGHNPVEKGTLEIGMVVYRVMFRYSNTQPDMTLYPNFLQISIPINPIEQESIPVLLSTEDRTRVHRVYRVHDAYANHKRGNANAMIQWSVFLVWLQACSRHEQWNSLTLDHVLMRQLMIFSLDY